MTTVNYGFKTNISLGSVTLFSGNGDVVTGGNLNLNGAKISADPATGAVAIIPAIGSSANPTAIIISPTGVITTANTVGGVLPSSAYTASLTPTTTTAVPNLSVSGRAVVTGNISSGNLAVSGTSNVGNLVVSSITWANGVSFVSGINYTASSNPPASGNKVGDQWYNTLNDTIYEYTWNGANYYWVDVTSPTVNLGSVNQTAPILATVANIASLTVTNAITWPNGAPYGTVVNSVINNVSVTGPAFSAILTYGQPVSSGIISNVVYGGKFYDTHSCYNTSTGVFTPNVAGYYQFNWTAGANTYPTSSGIVFSSLYKNSIEIARGARLVANTGGMVSNGSTSCFMNGTTDYVQVRFDQASGSSVFLEGDTGAVTNGGSYANYFNGVMIRGQ